MKVGKLYFSTFNSHGHTLPGKLGVQGVSRFCDLRFVEFKANGEIDLVVEL